jgi:hypothetical protein
MADKMSGVDDVKVALVCNRLSMGFVRKPAQDLIFGGGINFVSTILNLDRPHRVHFLSHGPV